jgi:hypothetical protein
MQPKRPRRRQFLKLAAGLTVAGSVAGCTDGGNAGGDAGADTPGSGGQDAGSDGADRASGDTAGPTDAATTSPEPASPTATPTPTPADAGELDRREANVVGVAFDRGDASYRFDVSLHHDDAGESGYANWWQIERPDGTRLGRRDLTHPHAQQPFERSATVEVPPDVSCVVVRGHDQTHGYGGRAVVVNLESGAQSAVAQGPERRTFDAGDCP